MQRRKFDEVFKDIASLFKLLAHEDRLRILCLIHDSEMDVGSISKSSKISQSRVSQHLKMLRLHHIVKEKRLGKRVLYTMTSPLINKIVLKALEFSLKDHQDDSKTTSLTREMKKLWSV